MDNQFVERQVFADLHGGVGAFGGRIRSRRKARRDGQRRGNQLGGDVVFRSVVARLGKRRVVIVTGDIGQVVRLVVQRVGAVEEAEVGAAVEHVEVDGGVEVQDLPQCFLEASHGQAVVSRVGPVVEPSGPKLGHHGRHSGLQLPQPLEPGSRIVLQVRRVESWNQTETRVPVNNRSGKKNNVSTASTSIDGTPIVGGSRVVRRQVHGFNA